MSTKGVFYLSAKAGYIEVFKDDLDSGKGKFEKNSGFFVFVHKRRVNVDDPGFGIERNLLRHGTFSRIRMIVHVDSLDKVLRSSRESLQQSDLYDAVQDFLRAGFNFARNKLVEHDLTQTPSARISARISSAPGSMFRKPLLSLARLVMENKATPFYLRFPSGLSGVDQKNFLDTLEACEETTDDLLRATEIVVLDSKEGLAVFDVQEGKLLINSTHPFFAAFQEMFTNAKQSLPLEMIVMSEILMEAHYYHMSIEENVIRDILARRDELLRLFVRSSARRTAGMIAGTLVEARNDKDKLEEEMRAAFEAIGFANVIHIGGKGNPDGTAEAYLAASEDGIKQRYKVGLEAKSRSVVSVHRLDIAAIRRHMRKYDCDHHLVIGNGFATSQGDDSATVESILEYREDTKNGAKKGEGKEKTITLMYIDDLARLIRIASSRRVGGLSRIRKLFKNCVTPEQSKEWVDGIASETPESWPYKEILETVWALAQKQPNEVVEYAAVIAELRHRDTPVEMRKVDLIDCCKAMQVMARGVVYARDNTVEIDRRPDLILEDIRAAVGELPEDERKGINI